MIEKNLNLEAIYKQSQDLSSFSCLRELELELPTLAYQTRINLVQ